MNICLYIYVLSYLSPQISTNLVAYQKVIFVNKSNKKHFLLRMYRVNNELTELSPCHVFSLYSTYKRRVVEEKCDISFVAVFAQE